MLRQHGNPKHPEKNPEKNPELIGDGWEKKKKQTNLLTSSWSNSGSSLMGVCTNEWLWTSLLSLMRISSRSKRIDGSYNPDDPSNAPRGAVVIIVPKWPNRDTNTEKHLSLVWAFNSASVAHSISITMPHPFHMHLQSIWHPFDMHWTWISGSFEAPSPALAVTAWNMASGWGRFDESQRQAILPLTWKVDRREPIHSNLEPASIYY